ncbi:MAG: putative RND superfamily exporter protein, partial [Myxococcota bacterium]
MSQDYTPKMFGRLARWVMRHPRQALALIGIACVLSGVFASWVRVNPDILALLPDDDPVTQAIQRLNDEEGGANLLTISVQGDDAAELDGFVDALAERIEGMEDVDYVLHGLDPELAWSLGVLQLTPVELKTIRDKLQGAIALGPAIQNPLIAGRVLALGPLTEKLAGADARELVGTGREDLRQILIRPIGSAYDPVFARPFMAKIYDTIEELDPDSRGLKIPWIGGAYRHSVEEVEGIIQDLSVTALLSLVLVTLVVGISFRDFRAVFLIFVPLLIGNLLTWGFAGAVVGTLTSFTSFFTAVLIGLGVDFSIHLYARYREERAQSDDLEEAVARAWDATGPPCTTAALTSAGGFCALWAASFEGFQQLGTLLAGGVLLCLLAVLVVLPLLILWRESQPKAVPLRDIYAIPVSDSPRYRAAPLALVLVAVVTVLAVLQLPNIGFEYDLSMMRQQGTAYDQLDETQQLLVESSYAPVVVSYDDDESLRADYVRLLPAVAAGELPHVESVLSIYTVLPLDQAERVSLLGQISSMAAADNARYLPRQIRDNLDRLIAGEPRVLAPSDLPRGLQHILGVADGRHRMMLTLRGNMWDMREDKALFDEIEEWLPGRPAASEFLASAVLYRLVLTDG